MTRYDGTPAQRVREFVEARLSQTGPIDREVVMDVWVKGEKHELAFADLLALCDSADGAPTFDDSPEVFPWMLDQDFMVTTFMHADCQGCLECAERARSHAIVTGSVGATYVDGPTVEHSATVRRSVRVGDDEMAELIRRSDRNHVLDTLLDIEYIDVARNRWAIEALAEMRGGWGKL